MKTPAASASVLVMKALRECGFLLETDAKLPSLCALVAGGPIRGSWWAHPRAHEIFAVLQVVADHKDVLISRLISGKVTFVHRKLWPDLFSIGNARQQWQMDNLSLAARSLLEIIDQRGELRSDQLHWAPRFKSVKPGDAVRELEKRLLIHSEEFHTESGSHAKLLQTWKRWAARIGFKCQNADVAKSMRKFEQRLHDLNERWGAAAALPWTRSSRLLKNG